MDDQGWGSAEDQEREELQRVARVMREGASRLPAESAVGALLEAGALRVLRLLSPPQSEPGRPPRRLAPTLLSGLVFLNPDLLLYLTGLLTP